METVQGEVPPYGVKETLMVNGKLPPKQCATAVMRSVNDNHSEAAIQTARPAPVSDASAMQVGTVPNVRELTVPFENVSQGYAILSSQSFCHVVVAELK